MNDTIHHALKNDRVIDITTTGRKTGNPHRIEIWFHNIAGKLYITGMPGRERDWYQNMVATPDFTFHLKDSTQADIPATARPVTEEAERRTALKAILAKLGESAPERDFEEWVEVSPLVELSLQL